MKKGLANMKVKTKILLGFIIALIPALILTIFFIFTLNNTQNRYGALLEDAVTSLSAMGTNTAMEQQRISKTALWIRDEAGELEWRTERIIIIFAVAGILSVAVVLIIGARFAGSIAKPLGALKNKAAAMAGGNLDISIRANDNSEMGQIANSMADMGDAFTAFVRDLSEMTESIRLGQLDVYMDEDKFEGKYREAASGVNAVTGLLRKNMLLMLDSIAAYAKGNFDHIVPTLPGDQAVFTRTFNLLKENLLAVDSQIQVLMTHALEGDLRQRVATDELEGGWKNIMDSLNGLLDAVLDPIWEAAEVTAGISRGDLSQRVTGNYMGDHAFIKDALNDTISFISSSIHEATEVLNKIVSKDLTVSIEKQYDGDFSAIRESINRIVFYLNDIIKEISSSSIQLAGGADQLSESAMMLAQGASEQAQAVDGLNENISLLMDQIQASAKNTKTARDLAAQVKSNAGKGNADMEQMLISMEDINTASESIYNIIKIIDGIAFQTNLLALNAAVEAARAGENGKGFAVVADEVRTLAGRSKNAAEETGALIKNTIEKVNLGSQTANKTAKTLDAIVDQINEMNILMDNIAEASNEQVSAVERINTGVSQISEVTISNTAASEEQASACEELSTQTEAFRNLVSQFNTKPDSDF